MPLTASLDLWYAQTIASTAHLIMYARNAMPVIICYRIYVTPHVPTITSPILTKLLVSCIFLLNKPVTSHSLSSLHQLFHWFYCESSDLSKKDLS